MKETFEKEQSEFLEFKDFKGREVVINKNQILMFCEDSYGIGTEITLAYPQHTVTVHARYEEVKQKLGVK